MHRSVLLSVPCAVDPSQTLAPSLSVSVPFPLFGFVCLPLSLSLSLALWLSLSISISISPSLSLSPYLSISLSLSALSVSTPRAGPSVCLSLEWKSKFWDRTPFASTEHQLDSSRWHCGRDSFMRLSNEEPVQNRLCRMMQARRRRAPGASTPPRRSSTLDWRSPCEESSKCTRQAGLAVVSGM